MNSLLFSSDTFCWKLKNNEIFCPGARRLRFIPFVPRLQSFLSLQSRTVSRVAEKQSSQQSWGCLSHKQKRARARWQLVYDWSISLEYQIYLPAIDTIVTGLAVVTNISFVPQNYFCQQNFPQMGRWYTPHSAICFCCQKPVFLDLASTRVSSGSGYPSIRWLLGDYSNIK